MRVNAHMQLPLESILRYILDRHECFRNHVQQGIPGGAGLNVQAARSRERRNRWGAQEDVGVSFFGFTVLPWMFSL